MEIGKNTEEDIGYNPNYFTSSDRHWHFSAQPNNKKRVVPQWQSHPQTFFPCLTFYLAYVVLTFCLAFYPTIYLTCSLAYILDIFSGISSDSPAGIHIPSGIYSDILSGIYSDILSGICCDILSGILSGNLF